MTNEQLEKAMEFILHQQAKLASQQAESEAKRIEQERKINNTVGFLLEHQAKHEEHIQALTSAVATLAIQADQDRTEIKMAINQMSSQAEKDRQEMRYVVDKLVTSINSVSDRVTNLENKI